MLQACFETTDWQVLRDTATCGSRVDLEEYTSTVLHDIRKFMENVTTSKTITVRPNQRPWLNTRVHYLLKTWDGAFRDGNTTALRAERRNFSVGTKRVRSTYALKIWGHFNSNDSQSMWKNIRYITEE